MNLFDSNNDFKYINKLFMSIDDKHSIDINIMHNVSIFQIIAFDYENVNTFIHLLKNTIKYLHDNNIIYVLQEINNDDIEYFSNSIITEQNNKIIAKTPIDYLADDIINALNIKIIS